jgi:drug/metabolite transporter (DMT)-like permease
MKEAVQPLLDRYWRPLSGNARGAIWMLLSSLAFISVQSVIKSLGEAFDSVQLTFFRSFFGGLAVLPFIMTRGISAFKTENLPFHVGRGLFGACAIFLMVYAVIHMPLADATVINFTRAFFMIVLAVIFLGEKVRWRRWTATAIGFSGIILMMRPGDDAFQLAALAAAGAAVCFAAAHVCIKKCTSSNDHPMTVQSIYWVISSAVTLIPTLWFWTSPDLPQWGLLIFMGLLSGIAQTLFVYSLNAGEATFVYPFDFTRLIWAALAGLIIFAEPLAWTTILGAAVIVASNIYIARRQALEDKTTAKGQEPSAN